MCTALAHRVADKTGTRRTKQEKWIWLHVLSDFSMYVTSNLKGLQSLKMSMFLFVVRLLFNKQVRVDGRFIFPDRLSILVLQTHCQLICHFFSCIWRARPMLYVDCVSTKKYSCKNYVQQCLFFLPVLFLPPSVSEPWFLPTQLQMFRRFWLSLMRKQHFYAVKLQTSSKQLQRSRTPLKTSRECLIHFSPARPVNVVVAKSSQQTTALTLRLLHLLQKFPTHWFHCLQLHPTKILGSLTTILGMPGSHQAGQLGTRMRTQAGHQA